MLPTYKKILLSTRGSTLMTTSPFMIFLNNWELILKYQHFLLDPYPFQGMIREPTQAVHAHM